MDLTRNAVNPCQACKHPRTATTTPPALNTTGVPRRRKGGHGRENGRRTHEREEEGEGGEGRGRLTRWTPQDAGDEPALPRTQEGSKEREEGEENAGTDVNPWTHGQRRGDALELPGSRADCRSQSWRPPKTTAHKRDSIATCPARASEEVGLLPTQGLGEAAQRAAAWQAPHGHALPRPQARRDPG